MIRRQQYGIYHETRQLLQRPLHLLEGLYTTLRKTPCGQYLEGKKQVLSDKQKQRLLSGTTIHEVHRLLRTAFRYAVEWDIIIRSPVPVDSPKKSTQERTIWTVEEMRAALDSMEDPILHLAVHLTLVGALREGEIVSLTPEALDFDAADGIGTFRINKSMQRVRKEALNQVDDGCIIKVFPDKLERSTTSLFPHPEKHQNRILLPHHLHDLCLEICCFYRLIVNFVVASAAFFAPAILSCICYPAIPVCKKCAKMCRAKISPLKQVSDFYAKPGKWPGSSPMRQLQSCLFRPSIKCTSTTTIHGRDLDKRVNIP